VRVRVLLLLLVVAVAAGAYEAGRRASGPGASPPESVPDDAAVQALRALPYAAASHDPHAERRGVFFHDRERAEPGFGFYTSRRDRRAFLIDMDGKVVHEWSAPGGEWQHATLLPDGGVLALVQDERILRLDRGSRELWSWTGRPHHDLAVDDAGNLRVLDRVSRIVPAVHPGWTCVDDRVVTLGPDGRELGAFSLLESVLRSPWASLLLPRFRHRGRPQPLVVQHPEEHFLLPSRETADGPPAQRVFELDPLHANHVAVLDGRLADRSPLFARGNLLVCLRNMNAIAVLDGGSHDVVWLWGPGTLTYPHDSNLLPNGNLLVFNNGLAESQVLEVDPSTLTFTWHYGPGPGFFSYTRGSCQRLPGGNTLITESDKGYAFEVDAARDVVWAFANPDVEGEQRAAIWRMVRFAPEELPFLGSSVSRAP
jgi:hypothetical protein